ncbi:MAG: hypothetical protein GX846_04615 [Deltaproteobacteria bacterium]|jgi:hypothetical protein|nr:hypothetical protein [Deltaproteobacteria bacterium]
MELSVNCLIELYKLASLGKMTSGLIHNINGPLQNIGLDLEMSQYMLKKEAQRNEGIILPRLRRIEEELERLNTMIKASSNRITRAEDNHLLNFNDYLDQELFFLNTNLYYKHNVKTTLDLPDKPPLVSSFPENSILAFGWLLQYVIEEIEKIKGSTLYIGAIKNHDFFEVKIATGVNGLFSRLNKIIADTDFNSDKLDVPETDSAVMLILKIFHSKGIFIKTENKYSSDIVICFHPG